jgi:hypothetical protein
MNNTLFYCYYYYYYLTHSIERTCAYHFRM